MFAKGYSPNWTKEGFVIKKVINTVPWTYIIEDFNREEIFGMYYEEDLEKTNQTEFRVEKVTKRKDDKLCVKWKGYDDPFNTCIEKTYAYTK